MEESLYAASPTLPLSTGLAAGWQRNHFHGLQLVFLVHTTHNVTLKSRVSYWGLLVFEKKLVRWDLFLEVFAMGSVCPFPPLLLLPGPPGPPPSVDPLACNQQAVVVSPRWCGLGWSAVFSCPGIAWSSGRKTR